MNIDKQAEAIARRIIDSALKGEMGNEGALDAVRIRTYSDAETYEMFGPQHEQETWGLHRAINRCLTEGFQRHGVRVEFVVLDRAAYRRWLRDRADSPALRERYVTIMEQATPTVTIEKRTLH